MEFNIVKSYLCIIKYSDFGAFNYFIFFSQKNWGETRWQVEPTVTTTRTQFLVNDHSALCWTPCWCLLIDNWPTCSERSNISHLVWGSLDLQQHQHHSWLVFLLLRKKNPHVVVEIVMGGGVAVIKFDQPGLFSGRSDTGNHLAYRDVAADKLMQQWEKIPDTSGRIPSLDWFTQKVA